eukprot:m.14102 g.14102  ORF g.14102 m.14102 type:complete len:193 (-) comp6142_c0_seq2:185-763(-)
MDCDWERHESGLWGYPRETWSTYIIWLTRDQPLVVLASLVHACKVFHPTRHTYAQEQTYPCTCFLVSLTRTSLQRLPNHAAKIKVGQYFGVEDADIQSAILEQRGDEETDMLPLVSDQADARDGADQSEEEGHQQEEGSQATGVDDNGDGETSDSDVELVQPGVASTELEPVKDDDEDEDDEATDDEAQEWL